MTISVKGIIHFHPDKGLIHPMSDLQGQLGKTAIIVNRKLFLLAWCEMKLMSLKLIKARHFRSIIFHGSKTVKTFYLQLHHEQIVKLYVLLSFKQLFISFLLHFSNNNFTTLFLSQPKGCGFNMFVSHCTLYRICFSKGS